ncbi:MAG: hypothetical protein ACO3H5_07630, partial [Candidatus Nanopelagicales bacterium]
MAGKLYEATSSFKPPQDKLKTEPRVSYSVSVDDRNGEGKTIVTRTNEDGSKVIIGSYPKRSSNQTSSSTGNFVRENGATTEEFNYFFANGNAVIATYAAPLVTGGGGNPNAVLGTNFASAPTAAVSTNVAAAGTPQLPEAADLPSPTIQADSQRTNFGSNNNLRYPAKLDLSKQDCIQFMMMTNEGRSLTGGAGPLGGLGNRNPSTKISDEINGTVTLPIQSGITDSNGVEWGGANLDAKDAYLARLALGGIQSQEGLGDNAGKLLGKVFQSLKTASQDPNIQSAINLYLAQEAVGVQGLLSRATGSILNPNLELLFNGPTLRSFSFTFRLSPRSKEEAGNVRRIIRFFKEGMVVKTASQGVFLKSPNIFKIKYL